MKIIIGIIATIILAYLTTFLPIWWAFAIAAFIVAAIQNEQASKSFLIGFLAIDIFWGISAFLINSANDGILANRIATMFGLSNGMMILLVTAIVGGLIGGFAALSGSFGRKLLLLSDK